MVRPGRGSHLGRPNRPSPSLRRGVSRGPLTRGPVRLLGPCFKTGRAGAQLRSATRGATCRLSAPTACRPSATTEYSERRGDLRGTGGAAPEGAGAAHVPSSAARPALHCALLVLHRAPRDRKTEVPARRPWAGLGCRSRAPRPGEVHASAAAAPTGPVLADPRPVGDVDRRAESPRARAAGPARLLLGGFTSS